MVCKGPLSSWFPSDLEHVSGDPFTREETKAQTEVKRLGHTCAFNIQARILEWVAMPSSGGSSQPRDRTHISLIAGGFFASWGTREAPVYSRAGIKHSSSCTPPIQHPLPLPAPPCSLLPSNPSLLITAFPFSQAPQFQSVYPKTILHLQDQVHVEETALSTNWTLSLGALFHTFHCFFSYFTLN